MKLKFECKKSKERQLNNHDCTIKILRNYDKERTCIVFRNGIEKKISPTSYVVYAIYQNRLYFKAEDQINGYKIYKSTTYTCRVQIQNKKLNKFIENKQGDYDMKFDIKNNLYYIELKEK